MTIRRAIELGAAALLALSWAGCGDDEAGDGEADGGDADGADQADGSIDAGDPGDDPGDLVGTWRYEGEGGAGESWVLTDERTFRYDRTGEDGSTLALEGSYRVEGDTLHFDGTYVDQPGTSLVSEMTFFAGGDRASIPAYVPVGDHDGWVGRWTMRYHNRLVYDDGRPDAIGAGGEEVLDLRDDGSGSWRLTFDDDTEPQLLEGTWEEGEGSVDFIQVEDDLEFPWSFPTLGDGALAQLPLDRVAE